jgi:imidazole glycerol-phosphate synthase subunit HisH
MKRVTVFDYGAGNLHSLAKALAAPGVDVRIDTDPVAALDTDVLVLPGVGAFGAAADRLAPGRDAMAAALDAGLPCLGICLGMQLLLDRSDEGTGIGLGVIPGRVIRLVAPRVPHIGWNAVESATDPLLAVAPLDVVYYAHSYVCQPVDAGSVTAWTEAGGDRFPAVVRWRRTVGVQFHPEKSSAPGVRFVQAFVERAFVGALT